MLKADFLHRFQKIRRDMQHTVIRCQWLFRCSTCTKGKKLTYSEDIVIPGFILSCPMENSHVTVQTKHSMCCLKYTSKQNITTRYYKLTYVHIYKIHVCISIAHILRCWRENCSRHFCEATSTVLPLSPVLQKQTTYRWKQIQWLICHILLYITVLTVYMQTFYALLCSHSNSVQAMKLGVGVRLALFPGYVYENSRDLLCKSTIR